MWGKGAGQGQQSLLDAGEGTAMERTARQQQQQQQQPPLLSTNSRPQAGAFGHHPPPPAPGPVATNMHVCTIKCTHRQQTGHTVGLPLSSVVVR